MRRVSTGNIGYSCLMDKDSGFTFVELIVVIVIIGVLAVIAVPRLTPQVAFDQAGFHQEVVSSLRYAQKYALAAGCPVRVVVGSNSIGLFHSSTCDAGDFSVPLQHPVRGGAYSVAAPSGVTLSPPSMFQFTPSGEASADASFDVLASTGSRAVAVIAATGYVDTP
jgi:MSHA pilin protein MshC